MRAGAGEQGLDFHLAIKESLPRLHLRDRWAFAAVVWTHRLGRRVPGTLAAARGEAKGQQHQHEGAGIGAQWGGRKRRC
jgi:hypothetical protein